MANWTDGPFNSNQVVLSDFRTFLQVATLTFQGIGQGGSITIIIAGVTVTVPTFPGDTESDIAARLAMAINADPTLAALGISGIASGSQLLLNTDIDNITITDPGIMVSQSMPVPTMSTVARGVTVAPLLLTAIVAIFFRRSIDAAGA